MIFRKMMLSALALLTALCGRAADPEETAKARQMKDPDRLVGVFPPEIRCVAVLSPASKPDDAVIHRGVAMLERAGLKVKLMPHAFTPHERGRSSAPLAVRLADWNAAVADPEVDMILCTRGGSGAQDLLDHIDWEKLKARDLPVLGFSNITVLTGAMLHHQAGYPLAGPALGSLTGATPEAVAWLRQVLAGGELPPVRLTPIRKGDARGPVYAGHLVLLHTLQQTPHRVDPAGRILFIECPGREAPVVKKYLDDLRAAGFFEQAKAVVFGHINRIRHPEAVAPVLEEFAAQVRCPVYKGFPYGHDPANFTLDFHREAVIVDDTLTFGPPDRPLPYRKTKGDVR